MPKILDPSLSNALERFVTKYLEFIRSEINSGTLETPRVLTARIEFSGSGFSVDEDLTTDYAGLVGKTVGRIHEHPQFEEDLGGLLANPTVLRFLRVGSGGAEPKPMNLEISLLTPLLTRYLKSLPDKQANALEFHHDTFANVYADLEEYLSSETDRYRIITLLVNFEANLDRVEVGPFVIRLLDNREVVELNQILPDYRAMPMLFPFEIPRFGLELRVTVPRGNPAGSPLTMDRIWWLVCCLALCKRGEVFYQDVWFYPDHWSPYPGVSRHVSKRAAPRGPKFVLTKEDLPVLQELWNSVESHIEKPPPFWLVAFIRFYESTLRDRLEDRLIDLWIACEALFGTRVEMGEMRYQLSLRLAHFLEIDSAKRRPIFDFAREAYKWRGKVVHGSPKIEPLKLRAMAEGMEDLVRRSLVKCLLEKAVSQEALAEAIENSILGT